MSVTDVPHLPDLRRIVTCHTAEGLSTIKSDTLIPSQAVPNLPARSGNIWTTEGAPTKDNNIDIDGATRELPGMGLSFPNGANFRFTDIAPGGVTPLHRTTTVDLNILISGEAIVTTEDGTEKHLTTPGDTLIQRGTMHAWKNPGKTWVRFATVLIDAEPAVVDGKVLGEAVKL
ncbi:hypothetical protein BV25DRAFT_1818622 [Artomyces pyxidatus]|uniref:Uncharacterized protein n=1 Tax=Artomyces pyxidatus TaxID=48021 RepID=A0ACB8TIJ1_9AGAM|nr:hypothetical protein BV25DRAFT_1818622 [Artomyces pyxidatus]